MNPVQAKSGSGEAELPQWYLAINNQPNGPMTLSQVAEHVKSGQANSKSMAWTAGMTNWQAAGELDQLKPIFQPPVLQPPPLMPPPLSAAPLQNEGISLAQAAQAAKQSARRSTIDDWLPNKIKAAPGATLFGGKAMSAGEQIKAFADPIQGDMTPKIENTGLTHAQLTRMGRDSANLYLRFSSLIKSSSPRLDVDTTMLRPA